MSTNDHRLAAHNRVTALIDLLAADPQNPQLAPLIGECQALARAIAAFHMEGIRFRMFNVDRILTRGEVPTPPGAEALFAETRTDLEAAGFHTRSHKAPG